MAGWEGSRLEGFWEGAPHRLSDKHYKFKFFNINSYCFSFQEVWQEKGKDVVHAKMSKKTLKRFDVNINKQVGLWIIAVQNCCKLMGIKLHHTFDYWL